MQQDFFRHRVDVLVIGGGQAGLSAGYHLAALGFANAFRQPSVPLTYAMLDAEEGPGGAWRHRWESLTMATVNNIFDLPDFPRPAPDPSEPSRQAIPSYFADFEATQQLAIRRPVTVQSVTYLDAASPQTSPFKVVTSDGIYLARAIINASGTWNKPLLPYYPGQETFTGPQIHTRNYRQLEDFTGQRVAIVGGGISALQILEEVSRVAETFWYTRSEPVFHEGPFTSESGRQAVDKVIADVEAGRPTGSVVSYTGLLWTDYALAARERGVLVRRPIFREVTPTGVLEADGHLQELDAIIWATGFKQAVDHLAPLGLANGAGAIALAGTQVAAQPRIHLVGYGPSQSTVGANRAGRVAARQLKRLLAG